MRKLASVPRFLPLEQAAKEFRRVHAMRRIVRTSVHTARFFVVMAKIARSCFLPRTGNPASRMLGIIQLNREGMQVDVSVGAIVRAQPATNAPVFDDDF